MKHDAAMEGLIVPLLHSSETNITLRNPIISLLLTYLCLGIIAAYKTPSKSHSQIFGNAKSRHEMHEYVHEETTHTNAEKKGRKKII
jgi:hypothetical protein